MFGLQNSQPAVIEPRRSEPAVRARQTDNMAHGVAFQLMTQSAHEEDVNDERIIDEGLPNAPN